MIIVRYALVARDDQDNRLVVVGTGREPLAGVRGRNVAPPFHRFLLSIFALHPSATSIETVSLASWSVGVDIETLPFVLLARKTEETRAVSASALAFSFPESETVQ